jgi:hypothetical protein
MERKRYDSVERIGLDMEPEDALEAILHGAGTEGEEVEMDSDKVEDEG